MLGQKNERRKSLLGAVLSTSPRVRDYRGLDSISVQATDQFGKRVGHCLLRSLLAADMAVFSLDVQRLTSLASGGNANQSDGIAVLIRIGSCNSRDRHGQISGER